MRHALVILAVILALSCGLIATASAEDYEVKLVRLAKIGDKYGVVASGSQEQHMSMTVNGQVMPSRDQVMQVAMTAKVEVLAVSAGGREAKASFTVDTLTKTLGDKAIDVLPAGTVVVAERVGTKTEFQVAGAPAKPDVAGVLKVVISMESDQGANDDAIFGTKERKKVGDSWPMDARAGAEDLAAKDGIKIDPANLTGTAALAEVLPAGMRITAKIAMKDVGVPLPPGMVIKSSVFAAEILRRLPRRHDQARCPHRHVHEWQDRVRRQGRRQGPDHGHDLEEREGNGVHHTVTPCHRASVLAWPRRGLWSWHRQWLLYQVPAGARTATHDAHESFPVRAAVRRFLRRNLLL